MDDNQLVPSNRMDNETGHDFISDLPLSVIHCILELVPVRDAVRTCLLSSQWRYKWASLPRLVFKDDCVDREGKSNDTVKVCLKNFITNALFLHKGPIHTFELSVSLLRGCPVTDRWLIWLSRNEIREFSLKPRDYDGSLFRVHSSLYSCQKLTVLELFQCELPPHPLTFKGFSCLRRVMLCIVKLPSNAVRSLFANSPHLESFIAYYFVSSEFRISAPKLTYFQLCGDFKEIDLYAPLVAIVNIDLRADGFAAEPLWRQSPASNFSKFLGGFTNLESLRGAFYFTKYLSIGIESYDHSLVFHHLKVIKLSQVQFQDIKEISVVVHLILGAPNLQTISISSSLLMSEDEAPPLSFTDFGCSPNCTFDKLRVIVMEDVCGGPFEMEFIKFLLQSSPVLETMTLHYPGTLLPEGISQLSTKLLTYSRASPNAKISLLQRSSLGLRNLLWVS